MFTGDYNFFDYKMNIPGYTGQDYGGFPQYLYLGVSVVLLVALLVLLRKAPPRKVRRIIGALGIFLTVLYVGKTAWETYYDLRQTGGFNVWLLPLDTCSVIMPAAILAGFAKGKLQRMAEAWIATGGVVGGFATMIFLRAFNFYPFLSFGAFYSMTWHFLMVFMGLLILVTKRPPLRFSLVTDGFLFHLIPSAVAIPLNYCLGVDNLDFMLYRFLGGVPFFEGIAEKLTGAGLPFLNPPLMLALYFAVFCVVFLIAAGVKNRGKTNEQKTG